MLIDKNKQILAKHRQNEFLFLLITSVNLYITIEIELMVIIVDNTIITINKINEADFK